MENAQGRIDPDDETKAAAIVNVGTINSNVQLTNHSQLQLSYNSRDP